MKSIKSISIKYFQLGGLCFVPIMSVGIQQRNTTLRKATGSDTKSKVNLLWLVGFLGCVCPSIMKLNSAQQISANCATFCKQRRIDIRLYRLQRALQSWYLTPDISFYRVRESVNTIWRRMVGLGERERERDDILCHAMPARVHFQTRSVNKRLPSDKRKTSK